MSQLTTAEVELEAAQAAFATAQAHANDAQAHAADLRQQVASGQGGVTPDQLAKAVHDAEHAALAATGASQGLAELTDVITAARTDEEVNTIVATLCALGDEVVASLDGFSAPFDVFENATSRYDDYVEYARARLGIVGQSSPRVKSQPYGDPRVDGIPLSKCRAPSLLARVVLSTMKAVRAPAFATDELRTLSQGASPLPTTTD